MLDGLIGGIANLIGFDMGRSAANKRQDKANRFTAAQAEIDRRNQLYFAQNSLGWMIDQVRQKGISPLAVMGNNPTFSPSFASGATGGSDRGPDLSKMGQGAGDLVKSLTRKGKQAAAIQMSMEKEELKKRKLENGILEEQYRKLLNRPSAPSSPKDQLIEGQDHMVNLKKPDQMVRDPKSPAFTAGDNPGYQWVQKPGGRWYWVASKELADIYESDTISWWQNNEARLSEILKGVKSGKPGIKPPSRLLRKGQEWEYDKRGFFKKVPTTKPNPPHPRLYVNNPPLNQRKHIRKRRARVDYKDSWRKKRYRNYTHRRDNRH
jgi:hypothetical protein